MRDDSTIELNNPNKQHDQLERSTYLENLCRFKKYAMYKCTNVHNFAC